MGLSNKLNVPQIMSTIYNSETCINNKMFVFSNAKDQDRLDMIRTRNFDIIQNEDDEKDYELMCTIEDEYACSFFLEDSLKLIIINKAQRRENGDLSIPSIYQFSQKKKVDLEYSGIVQFMDVEVFDKIADHYLDTYNQFKKIFNKVKVNKVDEVIKYIKDEWLELVFQVQREANPWLFDDTNEYIRKILFNEEIDNIDTASVYDNTEYHSIIQSRIKQMIT